MEKGIELKIIKKNWKSMWRGNSNITEAIIYLFFFYLLSSTGPRPIDVVSLRYRRKETKEKEKNNDVLKNVCLLSIYPRAPLSLSLSVQSLLGVTPRWSCGLLLANIQLRNLSLSLTLHHRPFVPLSIPLHFCLSFSCSSCCKRNCSISCPVRRVVVRSCWINSSRLYNIAFLRCKSFVKKKRKKNRSLFRRKEFEEERNGGNFSLTISQSDFFYFRNLKIENCRAYVNFKSCLLFENWKLIFQLILFLNY